MQIRLVENLELSRCPHCFVDKPNLVAMQGFETTDHKNNNHRFWGVYECKCCGGLILASSPKSRGEVKEIYPKGTEIDPTIPARAREYLRQARESIHSPAGSVILSASAVDAMLKKKGYSEGSLFNRINKAKEEHLITDSMADWAHEVRLDANEQRHDEESVPLPNEDDARRILDFALALAQFLFVLPARIQRGLSGDATKKEPEE